MISFISSLITSIGLKTLSKIVFHESGDEYEKRIKKAIQSAVDIFMVQYGEEFGKESESFLAREHNWVVFMQAIRFDKPDLKIEDINPKGYKGAKSATPEALIFFIETLNEELKNDYLLSQALAIKNIGKQSSDSDFADKLNAAIDRLDESVIISQENNTNKELSVEVEGGDLPKQYELEEGKFYERKVGEGDKIIYMRRGDKIFAEYYLRDGSITYLEIDENASISIINESNKLPYRVHPNINEINRELEKLNDGRTKLIIEYEWGLVFEGVLIGPDQFTDVQFKNAQVLKSTNRDITYVFPKGYDTSELII